MKQLNLSLKTQNLRGLGSVRLLSGGREKLLWGGQNLHMMNEWNSRDPLSLSPPCPSPLRQPSLAPLMIRTSGSPISE